MIMDDAAKTRIGMFDVIRSTVPLEGYDNNNALQKIPVGSEGTVVEVYGGGKAFEVDFDLRVDPTNPERFTTITMSVNADQCELVWKCPHSQENRG